MLPVVSQVIDKADGNDVLNCRHLHSLLSKFFFAGGAAEFRSPYEMLSERPEMTGTGDDDFA